MNCLAIIDRQRPSIDGECGALRHRNQSQLQPEPVTFFFLHSFFLFLYISLLIHIYIFFFFVCVWEGGREGGREGGTSILFLCFVLSGFLRVFLSVSFLSCCWKGPPLILGSSKTSEEGSKQEAGVLLAIERFSAVIIAGTVIRKRFELSTRRDQSLRSLRNSSSGILSLSLPLLLFPALPGFLPS